MPLYDWPRFIQEASFDQPRDPSSVSRILKTLRYRGSTRHRNQDSSRWDPRDDCRGDDPTGKILSQRSTWRR